jgi:hypothetical protein
MPHRLILPVLAAILIGMITTSPRVIALAQESTPTANPEASQCTIEARPIDFLVPIVEAPDPETTPTPIAAVPTGTDVDAATRDAVLTVVYTLTACVNAGDYLRAFALYDDAYLRRIIDPEGLMGADIAIELGKQFQAVHPSEEDDLTRIVQVVSVAGQTDGAISVAVETSGGVDREQNDSQIDVFVLRETEAGWKIVDGASDLPNLGAPDTGESQ